MPIAAVPAYLGSEFKDASPGLRFGMYLKLWGVNRGTKALLWQTHDLDYQVRGQDQREREIKVENKTSALADSTHLTLRDKALMQALASRQVRCAHTLTEAQLLRLDAQAIAPFTTGLGNEHPLENGFAFLNPYGLPYLPGSGVKGVLRQAARELASGAWGDAHGWSEAQTIPLMHGEGERRKPVMNERTQQPVMLSLVDVLFGRESAAGDTDHVRGALTFWDVIPQIKGDRLMVEIMTPHQSHYYQERQDPRSGNSITPHDSGQPNPISFLTVPPGSGFAFHVVCDAAHLARLAPALLEEDDGAPRWKQLLTAAFEHAFAWLGFGAKTAVGYGAMARDTQAEAAAAEQAELARRQAELATLSAARKAVAEFENYMQERAAALGEPRARRNESEHQRARELAKRALEAADWTPEERAKAADAIERWLPKVVNIPESDRKDEFKKLRLKQLRGES
jgi:CRISPR-associated protein Cmr6